ncbi:MAG: tRNA A37 threonylcarbamoyladenosine dehydratase [Psychroserpens sp.]
MCYDTIDTQILELLACRNPSLEKVNILNSGMVDEYLRGKNETRETYGVWVYYPWKNQLVHILDEEEFIEVRTNRNKYKITQEEQDLLRTKIIGIAGLSVGRAVATTMALERICGEIRLADFDDLELSNLNRINAPLSDMGIPKTISAAREIMEVDPFIKITCYSNGLTEENLEDFFLEGGKMDLFIEECDGLDIKVLSRIKAKQLGIPVVMEASDRAVLDIERFDLEPNRKILHGSLDGLDVDLLKSLKTNEEKMPYMLSIVGYETLSNRIKSSMLEIKESITTWPQLSSAISFGGGLVTNVSRRILLNQLNISGRFYNDMADLVNDSSIDYFAKDKISESDNLQEEDRFIFESYVDKLNRKKSEVELENTLVKNLIKDASLATSIANSQPWKWVYKEGVLYLFRDKKMSESFWDRSHSGSMASLGASIRNLELSLEHHGYIGRIQLTGMDWHVATIKVETQKESGQSSKLYPFIEKRYTNRQKLSTKPLSDWARKALLKYTSPQLDIQIVSDASKILKLGILLGSLDRIRVLNEGGHKDFYREISFNENHRTNVGIPAESLGLDASEYAGLRIAKEPTVVSQLSNWGLGSGLDSITKKFVDNSSAIVLMTVTKDEKNRYVNGGKVLQEMWLDFTKNKIAIHPITTAVFAFQLLDKGDLEGFSNTEIAEMRSIQKDFYSIFDKKEANEEFFLFRVFEGGTNSVKSSRRDVDEILFFMN